MDIQREARNILRDEFTKRNKVNPRYSLRSFANTLGISPTVLSLVMSGKRPLSKKAAALISERLALGPVEAQLLKRRASGESTPLQPQAYEFQKMELERFELISDWVHLAILSLLEVEGFQADMKWIAKRLGVTEMAAKTAFERLQELKLIEKTKGKWRQTSLPIKVENKISTPASRKFQRQLLEKAIESLESDPIEVRDFSSMTLAMDPKLIPYAVERIRAFRRELTAELEFKAKGKEVYNLTVQIFPVSKTR